MADFDVYKQTEIGVQVRRARSFDSARAISKGDTVFLAAGEPLPLDLSDLKIVNGAFIEMTDREKRAISDRIEELEQQDIEANVTRPDPQIDVLSAVILFYENETRAEVRRLLPGANLPEVQLPDAKRKAAEIALSLRRSRG